MWKIICLFSVEGVEEDALMKFHLLEMHHLSNNFSELEWSVPNMYSYFEPGTFRKGSYT